MKPRRSKPKKESLEETDMERGELLSELNSHVMRAQRVLAKYLPEDSGKTEKDTIAELLGILDNRELHAIQKRIRRKRALFTEA